MPGAAVRSAPALAALLLAGTLGGVAATLAAPGAFSAMPAGGAFADGWSVTTLPDIAPTRYTLSDDGGRTVVRADATGSAASLIRSVRWDAAAQPWLDWRWRVDRVVADSDITTKQGDDFAARLYVFFDFPFDELSLFERTKLRVARWLYGEQVPAAALCYVWANREPPGTTAWNAYTSRVRMVVLRNADDAVGEWTDERRDLAADFRAAFGDVPPVVTGLAIAADTDQTGERVTAWFGDIRRSAR